VSKVILNLEDEAEDGFVQSKMNLNFTIHNSDSDYEDEGDDRDDDERQGDEDDE
jgi:hypothetical protein